MGERLNGWKAIAGYFGRDRTTVMRWARERDLPVHRLPGGKIGGVFAIPAELDRWRVSAEEEPVDAAMQAATEGGAATQSLPEAGAVPPVPAPSSVAASPQGRWLAAVLAVLVAAGGLVWWQMPEAMLTASADAAAMPASPELASLYVEARDEWAERTAASLDSSIGKLRRITAREPGFAAGHAALAEALLLAGEFGAMPYDQSMKEARASVDRALALDPGLPDANRADGFIAYWWERQPGRASRAFHRAIGADPDSAQTHFWYANILSDNGEHDQALQEFDRARLLEPGSVPIATDYGWALWAAGRTEDAKAVFGRLLARGETAVLHDSLSHLALSEGDYRAYADHLEAYARLRKDADSVKLARDVRAAVPDGDDAVLAVVLDDALQDVASGKTPDRVWATFVASLKGDRVMVAGIMDSALRRKEVWGGAAFTRRIAERWQADPAICASLARLTARPMGGS